MEPPHRVRLVLAWKQSGAAHRISISPKVSLGSVPCACVLVCLWYIKSIGLKKECRWSRPTASASFSPGGGAQNKNHNTLSRKATLGSVPCVCVLVCLWYINRLVAGAARPRPPLSHLGGGFRRGAHNKYHNTLSPKATLRSVPCACVLCVLVIY